jgi:RimJ/RimL family protein N-acetyltransferase
MLPELRGLQVLLRSPREADKSDRLECGRDAEFVRMVGGDPSELPPLTVEEVDRWYERIASEPYSWIIERDGRCVGTARLHALDPATHSAWYAIGIFDVRFWNQGLGTETTLLVLKFAFDQLRLYHIFLRVLEYNHRAIAVYKKCGFAVERVEQDSVTVGDQSHSDLGLLPN